MPKPKPSESLRALQLLAPCRDGCPEALMIAHGFTARQLTALVRDGLGHRDDRTHVRGQDADAGHARADHGGGAAGAGRARRRLAFNNGGRLRLGAPPWQFASANNVMISMTLGLECPNSVPNSDRERPLRGPGAPIQNNSG